ncbi:hypothetical protein PG990_005759 [Apiospora arundinis]|jgi:hypothetical protein|uniref:Uncharacterized protein n=1 Tax=Apiospora arundinis TaxID=335852 RepID=A0ABR2J8D5_9PEZI
MQFPKVLAALVSVASFSSAAPTQQLAKRELGGVLICQGVNATGPCHYEVYSMQDCHDLPDNLSGNAATFAPDGDSFYCYPRVGHCSDICTSPTGCTFGAVNFSSPVKYDLTSIQWNTLIQAFHCYENTTSTAASR